MHRPSVCPCQLNNNSCSPRIREQESVSNLKPQFTITYEHPFLSLQVQAYPSFEDKQTDRQRQTDRGRQTDKDRVKCFSNRRIISSYSIHHHFFSFSASRSFFVGALSRLMLMLMLILIKTLRCKHDRVCLPPRVVHTT